MKHITILVPERAILGSLEGSRLLLTQVNEILKSKEEAPIFHVQLAGMQRETKVSGSLYTVHASLISEIKKTDLVIIPAVDGDVHEAIEKNRDLIPWIVDQYARGAEVASLCMGAFILAASGLVNGRKCATHWMAENTFRKMFPEVDLVTEKIITDELGIYSSGGAFSYLNLILHLIEKYAGHAMAVLSAKVFAIEIGRVNQLSFAIFQGQKDHEDEPIKKAQEFIEKNYQDKITVDQLASMFALGRRNLERRFKKATSNTVVEYIQRVKVEAVKKGLEASRKNVTELMYDVGYSDVKAFRTVFKKITGKSPIDYRNKYNRDMAVA